MLATSIWLAMTACGAGALVPRDDSEREERPSSAVDAAIDEVPSHGDASPGEDRAAPASEAMPARQPANARSPALPPPVIAAPSLRKRQLQALQREPQVMVTTDPAPLDIAGFAAPAPLREDEEEGCDACLLLCCGAVFAVMWLTVRRRRGRRRPPVRDQSVVVPWHAAKALKPHWDYDPQPFDSDAFLSRWETIELCIHGDMELMDAIAGQRMPGTVACAGWSAVSAPHAPARQCEAEVLEWWCEPIEEDRPYALLQWHRPDLRIDGDAHLLAALAGRMALPGAMNGEARAASDIEAPGGASVSEPVTTVGSDQRSKAVAGESLLQDQTASPYQDISDTDLIARSNAWIGEMRRRGLSDADGAWLLVQSLMARAGQRVAREAATLQEAAAKFAGWTANLAPRELRPSWRARWLDIQVARLRTLKGASRLLGFHSLDADCAADVSPEVMEARVRLLLRWSEGLIGTAARTKRAEADALAMRLRQMHDESQLAPAPVHRQSTY